LVLSCFSTPRAPRPPLFPYTPLFRSAAVGLGETAHDTEGGAEEALADRGDVLACERPRLQLLAVLIELMPEQHAERGPDRTERDRTQQPAGEFADPFHGSL